jgi:hypothetical protein
MRKSLKPLDAKKGFDSIGLMTDTPYNFLPVYHLSFMAAMRPVMRDLPFAQGMLSGFSKTCTELHQVGKNDVTLCGTWWDFDACMLVAYDSFMFAHKLSAYVKVIKLKRIQKWVRAGMPSYSKQQLVAKAVAKMQAAKAAKIAAAAVTAAANIEAAAAKIKSVADGDTIIEPKTNIEIRTDLKEFFNVKMRTGAESPPHTMIDIHEVKPCVVDGEIEPVDAAMKIDIVGTENEPLIDLTAEIKLEIESHLDDVDVSVASIIESIIDKIEPKANLNSPADDGDIKPEIERQAHIDIVDASVASIIESIIDKTESESEIIIAEPDDEIVETSPFKFETKAADDDNEQHQEEQDDTNKCSFPRMRLSNAQLLDTTINEPPISGLATIDELKEGGGGRKKDVTHDLSGDVAY